MVVVYRFLGELSGLCSGSSEGEVLREKVKPCKGSDTWFQVWRMVVRSVASSGRWFPTSRAVSDQDMRGRVRPTGMPVCFPPPSFFEGPLWSKNEGLAVRFS